MENWREKKLLQMEEQSTPVGTTERERNRYGEEQSTPVGTREGEGDGQGRTVYTCWYYMEGVESTLSWHPT